MLGRQSIRRCRHADASYVRSSESSLGRWPALTRFATCICFTNFDDPLQKLEVLHHSSPYSHCHVPSRVLIHIEVASKLTRADAFPGVKDQGDCQEPLLQIQVCPVENRADRDAIRGIAGVAVVAMLPLHRRRVGGLAIGATGFVLPAHRLQMSQAIIVRGELFVDADDVHVTLLSSLPQYGTRLGACQGKNPTLN